MAHPGKRESLVDYVKQSSPVDTRLPFDPSNVAGKTILITGGASGFGEGFFREWAKHGANVIIGDINDARGHALVAKIRRETGNENHHYIHCNVVDWQSQVDFFKTAIQLSPHGGIDAVVANAGIADRNPIFEVPTGLDVENPPKPNLLCFEVDLIGVMYTAHLALFHLPRNPNSKDVSTTAEPSTRPRDRHLLLIGSIASLGPLPGQVQYNVAKHGVLGLFRSLRGTTFRNGVRINMLCPYFIDTPILPTPARLLLAGGAMGKPEDVVDAGTRFMADSRIAGRSLVIGPRISANYGQDNDWAVLPHKKDGKEVAVWEAYAHDFEECDAFVTRYTKVLNQYEAARGWVGWTTDVVGAIVYPFRSWLGR
jgi:NAD(P)-dependent dehydrogenase (short-subunit alcohol dehydrogenase family)